VGEQNERQRRRQGEAAPGGQSPEIAGAQQPDRESDLAARRTRQELAERHQVRIVRIVEPAPALDELGTEISEMRDRTAEAGEAEPQERQQHLAGGIAQQRLWRRGRHAEVSPGAAGDSRIATRSTPASSGCGATW